MQTGWFLTVIVNCRPWRKIDDGFSHPNSIVACYIALTDRYSLYRSASHYLVVHALVSEGGYSIRIIKIINIYNNMFHLRLEEGFSQFISEYLNVLVIPNTPEMS